MGQGKRDHAPHCTQCSTHPHLHPLFLRASEGQQTQIHPCQHPAASTKSPARGSRAPSSYRITSSSQEMTLHSSASVERRGPTLPGLEPRSEHLACTLRVFLHPCLPITHSMRLHIHTPSARSALAQEAQQQPVSL